MHTLIDKLTELSGIVGNPTTVELIVHVSRTAASKCKQCGICHAGQLIPAYICFSRCPYYTVPYSEAHVCMRIQLTDWMLMALLVKLVTALLPRPIGESIS